MTTTVEFQDHSQVEVIDTMGGDDSVLQAMRVSVQGADAIDAKADQGRINFLVKNRHGTPFEHSAITAFVEAPIFVFREFHRHRIGFSYNEVSGRYSQLPAKYYVPPMERPLMQIGKPGAYTYVPGTIEQYDWLVEDMKTEAEQNYARYEARLEAGIAKEVARMSLGVNIFSAMFVTCNPRSLMSFLALRTQYEDAMFKSTPMYEIARVADKLEDIFAEHWPMTHQAFNEFGRVSP